MTNKNKKIIKLLDKINKTTLKQVRPHTLKFIKKFFGEPLLIETICLKRNTKKRNIQND